jgi:DNA-binding MarR family transcriptional regulator
VLNTKLTLPPNLFQSTALIKCALILIKKVDTTLVKECYLTHSQCMVLVMLKYHKVLSQGDIAQILNLTPAAVSRLTETLVEKGFIARHENPTNRRENQVSLTKSGAKQLEAALQIIHRTDQELFADISAPDKAQFERITKLLLSKVLPSEC